MRSPDSDLDRKVQSLRALQQIEPDKGLTDASTLAQELMFIQNLERDGYISAKFRMGINNIPNLIWDIHVLEKGIFLIEEYESHRSFKGIWKRYHLLILGWILGIASAFIIAYLTHVYIH